MVADSDFVHLHVHTDYSMLDGAAKIKALVAETKRLGQRAVAITDHGYLFGAYEHYAACKAAGIKPIIGLEAYATPGTSRKDRTRVQWGDSTQSSDDVSARGAYTHLTLLSRTTEGMHNLFRIGSHASLEGQWGKWPRLDRELLEQYSKGLICTAGCPSGEVQTRLRLGQWDEAVRAAAEMQDIFGRENYYVEFMDHGIDIERRVKKELLRLARHIGAPVIATNDSHYVKKDDHSIQDAMLCLNSGSLLSDPDRFKFDGSDYYLRSSQDMAASFGEIEGAISNTVLIAEQCEVKFHTADEGANFMPRFPVPPGEDEHSWFIKEVDRGLEYRFPQGIPDQVRERADFECKIITQMGFPGYFLVVADFINWAKNRDIRVGPGRGSGAGSMVAYAMRITDLNPIEHGLLFERFLNPERVSMPDFDVDFDERRRGEVIEYVSQKYGDDRVAQVVTYGTIKAKQALKDSARVLGYPYAVGEQLTKAMPPSVMGKDIPVVDIFNEKSARYAEAEEFRKLHAADPDAQKIVSLAKGLEGLTRQWGVHACAVIMSSEPLIDIIPMMKRPADGAIITQFEYPTCEALGLLKMDFLGLRNLTVISDALNNIEANGKAVPDLEHVDVTDKTTYELLSRGDTLGVFQLDGGGMRTLLRQMRPDNFEDISAVGALYRPGPMGAESHTKYALRKNGREMVQPIHPELADALREVLEPTYGLIVYQEQVMAIAQKVAGYSLGQADLLRRAMGKKKKEILDREYVPFRDGMFERGFSESAVKTLWDILVPFSNYAFNKSHSAAYGLVSYWTAYLKANYPTEYMAALLTSQKDNKDKLGLYLGECRRMGITVLPPDVNASAAMFTPVGADIRFGLAAVRNVGINVVEAIVEARKEKGNFTSFQDFLDKVSVVVCNKRTIESLIKAGAFDSLGQARRALTACHEEAVDAVVGVKRNEAKGQFDLFAAMGGQSDSPSFSIDIPAIPEWDKKVRLGFEREMLGLYVSDHPLRGLERVLAQAADCSIAELQADEKLTDGKTVVISGLITSIQRKTSKQGSIWAVVSIEDLEGSMEALCFPTTYQTISTMLVEDSVVSLRGRIKLRDEEVQLNVQELTLLNTVIGDDAPVEIIISENQCTVDLMNSLGDIIKTHSGEAPVYIRLRGPVKETLIACDERLRVNATNAFYSEVKVLLGPSCIAKTN